MTEPVRKKAFAESTLAIPAALKEENWPLLDHDLKTVIRHHPTMPLTILQKRWLKALLFGPRIALFDPNTTGLEDIEPLYNPSRINFSQEHACELTLLLRVLSFGPVSVAAAPPDFIDLMKERLTRQNFLKGNQ